MTRSFIGATALGVIAIFAFVSCGKGETLQPSPTPTPTPNDQGGVVTPQPSTPTATPRGTGEDDNAGTPPPAPADLQVSLELGGETYSRGEPVEMSLTITNTDQDEAVLSFSDGLRYDFVAVDGDGREVWRWSDGKLFTQVLGEETIAPGGSLVYRETWGQADGEGKQVPDGEYAVLGLITGCAKGTSDCDFQAPGSIRIG